MRQLTVRAACRSSSTQGWLNAATQLRRHISACVTVPQRMWQSTRAVDRKYMASTPVSDILCAASMDGLTLSSTINEICSKLGMMPMPRMVQQHANERVGYVIVQYSPSERRPIDEYFAGVHEYETLRDIAAMHMRGIWTLSDAAGAGGSSLPDDLTSRTEDVILKAIHDADMWPATVLSKKKEPLSMTGSSDLYMAITTAFYSAYSVDDEKANAMHGSGGMGSEWATNEALRVLTIDERFEVGWPADCLGCEHQLFVRKEYDRVFDALFMPTTDETRISTGSSIGTRALASKKAYIMGTPGIGKTYMSSYFLWRLLSFNEVEGLRYVMYSAWDSDYIFDKMKRTAATYPCGGYVAAREDFRRMCEVSDEETGILLFGCSEDQPMYIGGPTPTIGFSLPDTSQFMNYYKDRNAVGYIVNVWEAPELCAWALCMGLSWPVVKKWYDVVGGMPRHLASQTLYENRRQEVKIAVDTVDMLSLARILSGERHTDFLTHALIKMVGTTFLDSRYQPRSDVILRYIMEKVRKLRRTEHLKWCYVILSGSVYGRVFDASFLHACGYPLPAKQLLVGCKALEYTDSVNIKPANRKVSRNVARRKKTSGLKKAIKAMEERRTWTEADPPDVEPGILYVPESQTFPLVDAFMLVKGVFICIQMTASRQQRTTDGLKDFKRVYDAMGISPRHKVIVFVQPPTVPRMTTVQWPSVEENCTSDLVAFWSGFTQYTYTVDQAFCNRILDSIEV